MDAQGDLSGFFILDTTQINGDPYYTNQLGINNGEVSPLPAWISQVSLTYTPDPGSENSALTVTNTSETNPIDSFRWQITDPDNFDPSSENFVGQMTTLTFGNGLQFGTSIGKQQEFTFQDSTGEIIGAEFNLVDPVDPVQVPGPLPLLGLAPFAYYFRKLKRNLKK